MVIHILRVVLAAAVVFGFATTSAFVITSPPELAGATFASPIVDCLVGQQVIEGPIIFPSDDILNDDSIQFDDQIVFIPGVRVRIVLDSQGKWEIERYKKRGAAGVVVVGVGPGTDGGALSNHVPDSHLCFSLPPMMVYGTSWEAGQNLSQSLLNYPNITARFPTDDYSDWLFYNRLLSIPFRLIFTSLSGITAAIALAKFIGYSRAYGCQFSVAQVMLAASFSVTIFRTIYHALDPIYLGRLFSPALSQATMSITFPFDLLGMFLVGLYWSELMQTQHVHMNHFLTRFRVVFLVITIVAFIAEIVSSALRASVANFIAAATIIGIIYVFFTIAMTAVFFYNGIKVLQYVRASNAATNPRLMNPRKGEKTLRRTSMFLICSALFNLVWLSGLAMAAVTSFSNTGYGFHVSMTTMWVGVTGGALTQVLALKMPPGSKWGARSVNRSNNSIESLVVTESGENTNEEPMTLSTVSAGDHSKKSVELSSDSVFV